MPRRPAERAPRSSGGRPPPADDLHGPDRGFVEELIEQVSGVIHGLAALRPPSDVGGWSSADTAYRGLHAALVALEDLVE